MSLSKSTKRRSIDPNAQVLDFNGNLILRSEARKIGGEYYEEGVTCIKMEDGLWYRTTTNKIVFDSEQEKWIFTEDAKNLCKGIVGGKVNNPVFGTFTASSKNIAINLDGKNVICINEKIANDLGFVENLHDGLFYDKSKIPYKNFTPQEPPNSARTQTYSLDDDKATKSTLIKNYENLKVNIDLQSKLLGKKIPFTFGLEIETSKGFLPERISKPLGVRALRDGSVSGIEYVTVPLKGSKGIQVLKNLCHQLSLRTSIDNLCSVHIHFGNVRRDKLYIISLWTLFSKIQDELILCFPYTRTQQWQADRKLYCKNLPDLSLNLNGLLKAKTKEDFQKNLTTEFNKIYGFLNSNKDTHNPAGTVIAKSLVKVPKKINNGEGWSLEQRLEVFSTKSTKHAVSGPKWNRNSRYYAINFLPLFFSEAHTIEFRIHEASTNFYKISLWLLICNAFLIAAEDFTFSIMSDLKLEDVFDKVYNKETSRLIKDYLEERKSVFCNKNTFRSNWKEVEATWLKNDKSYIQNFSCLI
jgi:hypothetical protein